MAIFQNIYIDYQKAFFQRAFSEHNYIYIYIYKEGFFQNIIISFQKAFSEGLRFRPWDSSGSSVGILFWIPPGHLWVSSV